MNKPLKVRTKVEAGVLVLILLSVSVSAVTIKFGTDSSGDTWITGMGHSDYVINSNGNAWEVTRDNIQQAIWDLNSTGGIVYIPACNITVSAALTIVDRSNITLLGTGRNTILYTSGSNGIINITSNSAFPDDVIGIIIEKIMFKGSGTGNTGYGIIFSGGHHNKVTNCFFSNIGNGIYLNGNIRDADNNWVVGNHLVNMQDEACIVLSGSSEDNVIQGNVIDASGSCLRGIASQGGRNSIVGNTIEEINQDGLYITGSKNIVSANVVGEITRYGIIIGGSYNVIVGNILARSLMVAAATGIYCYGHGHVIKNNFIEHTTGGTNGIYILASAYNITISENQIYKYTTKISDGTQAGNTTLFNNHGYRTFFQTGNCTDFQAGFAWFDTTVNKLYMYNGTDWVSTTFT